MNGDNFFISADDVCRACQINEEELIRLRRCGGITFRNKIGSETEFEYQFNDLSKADRDRYFFQKRSGILINESDVTVYAKAPDYARKQADKYMRILTECAGMHGNELNAFVTAWNFKHPGSHTSTASILRMRRRRQNGISGLLSQYGKRNKTSAVPDELFNIFKAHYLSDGRPSAVSCWKHTLGYAAEHGYDAQIIPSHTAFSRRLRNEIPESAIYTAREGYASANRKYGYYIKRSYNDLLAGEAWVSDHAQIDVAVTYNDHGKLKVGYPWLTAWRDLKSGLFLGDDIHMQSPNSDHIYYSFYRSGLKNGIPAWMYLDNGKDYRCKDFAGGRKQYKLLIDEQKMNSLTAALGIQTIYAWPYNAQAKPIERDFNRIKEGFSKHAPGYRGGDVVERPEAHNETIASGKIMSFDEFKTQFSSYIYDILMQTPISTGYRTGRSPQEIWNEEYPRALEEGKVKIISKQSLMLFCTRTSNVVKIGRRGIHDGQYDVDYYDGWMEGMKGRSVYLRRDPADMREAWVFDAKTHEYINNAYLNSVVDAIAKTAVSRAALQEQIAIKRQSNKIARALSTDKINIPFADGQRYLKVATDIISKQRGFNPDVSSDINPAIMLTDMDAVHTKSERLKQDGVQDLSALRDRFGEQRKPKLKLFESDVVESAVNY